MGTPSTHTPAAAASPRRALVLDPASGLATALGERGLRAQLIDVNGDEAGAVERAVREQLDATGDLDLLVNVLGPVADGLPPEELPTETWCEALERSVTRTLVACQVVGRHMLAREHGVIVTVLAGAQDDVAAGVLDAAATGLMRVLGVEWAPHGVRVLTVVPKGAPNAARDAAVSDTIAFLASDAASFVTASEIEVTTPPEGSR